jgi:hypothetical protein
MEDESARARRSRIERRGVRVRELLELLGRLRSRPTPEDAIALHAMHARHEREVGHEENAARAAERARAVAERLAQARRSPRR